MTGPASSPGSSDAGEQAPPVDQTKYRQLRTALSGLVADHLSPGDPIPSERDLMRRFGVSRTTVRTAISGLVTDGVLQRHHGKGTFVAERRVSSRLHLASFTEDMRRRGLRPTTSVLSAKQAGADAAVAGALDLELGAPCARIERLRLADGRPMAHEIAYYALARLPGLLDEDLAGSIYAILRERYDLPPDDGEQLLWSEPAVEPQAALLEVTAGAPLLVFQRNTDARRTPIEHSTSWYRADRYRLAMRLGPQPLD